jgi:uncharacterized membrane protein YfcA
MSLLETFTAAADGMLLTHPPAQIGLLFSVALVAGLARGFSGFGGGLIFIPLASAVAGPQIATPLLLIVDGLMTLGMLPNAWRRAAKRDVATLLIGAVIGVPVGTALLALSSPTALRWAISAIVFALLAFLISGWRYRGQPEPAFGIGTGFLAGLFGGVAQLSGPPVVAYWLGGAIDRSTVRANLVVYFALASVLSALSYFGAGLLTMESLMLAALVGPGYGIGIGMGARLFGLADETTFRRICYGLIAASALISLPILDAAIR